VPEFIARVRREVESRALSPSAADGDFGESSASAA